MHYRPRFVGLAARRRAATPPAQPMSMLCKGGGAGGAPAWLLLASTEHDASPCTPVGSAPVSIADGVGRRRRTVTRPRRHGVPSAGCRTRFDIRLGAVTSDKAGAGKPALKPAPQGAGQRAPRARREDRAPLTRRARLGAETGAHNHPTKKGAPSESPQKRPNTSAKKTPSTRGARGEGGYASLRVVVPANAGTHNRRRSLLRESRQPSRQ